MAETPTLTEQQVIDAVRNDHPEVSFSLGDRVFPIKDLSYDDYLAFMRTAKPVIEAVAGALQITPLAEGNAEVQFNPLGLDLDKILELAGNELPQMALICCRASDPKISIREIKKLAPRPQMLIQAVLKQIKQNDLIREFASFFPQLLGALRDLVPDVDQMIQPVTSTTEGIPSSS